MAENNLDNLNFIRKLDSKNMLGSLEMLSKQVAQVWGLARQVRIPAGYKNVNNVLVAGMGGSALGTHVVKAVFSKELKMSVEILNDYHLPRYVNNQTLVLISSYSGTTEEPLQAMKEAIGRKAKIMAICSGGRLGEWAKAQKIPALIFSPDYNLCGSPRMGLGYSIIGQLALFGRAGLVKFGNNQVQEIIETIKEFEKKYGAGIPAQINAAKQLVKKIKEKSVWYSASEHLVGSAHVAANQMNENGKRFAGYFVIPELNHHLMEGMLCPKNNTKNLLFVFFESGFYDSKVQKRYEVTKEILNKNSIQYISYVCQSKSALAQACELLVFSSYFSYYAAMLEKIDPTAIPFVDYFKAQLKK